MLNGMKYLVNDVEIPLETLRGISSAGAVSTLLTRKFHGGNDVAVLKLDRGAGFYYDYCIASRDGSDIHVYLTGDGAGPTQYAAISTLVAFPPDEALWCDRRFKKTRCGTSSWKFAVVEEDFGEACTARRKEKDVTLTILTEKGAFKPVLLLSGKGHIVRSGNARLTVGNETFSLDFGSDDYFGGVSSYDISRALLGAVARGQVLQIQFKYGFGAPVELGGSAKAISAFIECAGG